MQFLNLEREEQLEEISEANKPQVILKHNTTCPISKGVLRSLKEEERTLPADTPFYILDILTYRNISDTIEKKFSVPHESP
ncbi:MAG TPA: monothiol bacilliredoxin BrxC family protein, partial [Segetibacter sp.]|nr:monothiol bacilliredoxin BrxC family protein [Segetibacter sp.]